MEQYVHLNSRAKVARTVQITDSILLDVDADGAPVGIDWMKWNDLKEAIPPAYTEYLGEQLLAHVAVGA